MNFRYLQISTDEERLRPENSEVERLLADNSKAHEILGWQPSYAGLNGFREGLAMNIDWFTQPENLKLYKSGIYNLWGPSWIQLHLLVK